MPVTLIVSTLEALFLPLFAEVILLETSVLRHDAIAKSGYTFQVFVTYFALLV